VKRPRPWVSRCAGAPRWRPDRTSARARRAGAFGTWRQREWAFTGPSIASVTVLRSAADTAPCRACARRALPSFELIHDAALPRERHGGTVAPLSSPRPAARPGWCREPPAPRHDVFGPGRPAEWAGVRSRSPPRPRRRARRVAPPVRCPAVEGSLELVDATEQRLEAGPEEVGHERVVEVEWAIDRAPAAASDDLSRHTDHHRIGWDRLDHHRVGTDARVVTNGDGSEHLGTRTDGHPVADGRVALASLEARPASVTP